MVVVTSRASLSELIRKRDEYGRKRREYAALLKELRKQRGCFEEEDNSSGDE
jgi:uncharacterized coiled-coil DUF342 family protein